MVLHRFVPPLSNLINTAIANGFLDHMFESNVTKWSTVAIELLVTIIIVVV